MRAILFLLIGFISINNLQGQHINCPGLYLTPAEIECPTGPSLIISVNYPLQTEFDLKLIRTSTGEIVEEFTITDPEGTNNSSFVHYFGVLETGNWTVQLNSYEYYWGGELICEVIKQIELTPCGTLSIKDNIFDEVLYYTNPIKNNIIIKLPLTNSNNTFSMTLFTIEGKKILNHKAIPVNGELKISQLSHLSNGLYILKVEDLSTNQYKKFKIIKN